MSSGDLPVDVSRGHLSVASVLVCLARPGGGGAGVRADALPARFRLASGTDGRHHAAFRPRVRRADSAERPATYATPPLLVLGDDFELRPDAPWEPMGNATVLTCDLERGRLRALTSIPGLPALYLVQHPDAVVVTSDLFLLGSVEGLSLRFDPAGIADLAHVGRPVGHRTLFEGVRMIPGGHALTVRDGDVSVERAWEPPEPAPFDGWDDYTALQADAFAEAVSKLDVRSCEFSLSSGLDSRATLAGLIGKDAQVRALTVSGETQCLDARTAERLCRAYGIEHQTIRLGEGFRSSLPELVSRASLLSCGLSSIWHAAQVHCYRVLGDPPPFNALSGYLGNQVGRRGTEGLTPRRTGTALLDPSLRSDAEPERSWYADAMQADGFLDTRFLIQEESTFGNLASYQIGNSHSVQQSAYAYRPLIENMWRIPSSDGVEQGGSHVQNLKHLFLGEPLHESFQRRYINRVGGLVARYPINWGWRSRGGVSPTGLWWGGWALVDAVVSSRYAETVAARLTRAAGVAGLHEFRPVHEWLHGHMHDFVRDELGSRSARESGLFDVSALQRAVDDYYADGRGFKEIALALDLALAARNFGARA